MSSYENLFYHNLRLITKLRPGHVFVFGSNSRGVHGSGSAKTAHRYFGARYGQAFGLQGNSYGIPTRTYLDRKTNNSMFEDIPLKQIQSTVQLFFKDVSLNPHLTFVLTRIGCGFAGYDDSQIAPLFSNPLNNMIVPKLWLNYIDHTDAIFVSI